MKCNKISLLIVGLVAFGFSACGNDDSVREPEPTDSRMVIHLNRVPLRHRSKWETGSVCT